MPTEAPVAKTDAPNSGPDFVAILRESLSGAVVLVDENAKVTGFNPRAEQLTGITSSKILGQGIESLPAPLQSLLKQAFSSGEACQTQTRLRNGKTEELTVVACATPSRGANAKISGCVLVLNDVSAVFKWEGNMRRLDRLHSVGMLSASMAHEIKNAFVAVRTFVDLLLERKQELELAGLVRQELSRIDALVGQMLKFSGPPRPTMLQLRLHFVLGRSLLLVQHLLNEKRIRLVRSMNASTDNMQGDGDQLEQAFLNLFFNAIDAMDSGGQLEIITELLPPGTKIDGLPDPAGQSFLKITIRDTGIGIPAENMKRLFEPFFTTKPEGTGLGLAITRRIIQEHQGTISVQSQPNRGTTFTLMFPASA